MDLIQVKCRAKKPISTFHMPNTMNPVAAVAALLGLGLAAATLASPSHGEDAPGLRGAIDQCAACHGKVGHAVSPTIPNLAGQSLEYMINQLQRFTGLARSDFVEDAIAPSMAAAQDRTRLRRSELMEQHASAVAADTLRNVVAYYSRLPCVQADRPGEPDATQTGIRWCADCHAPQKVRAIPSIPYIYGQNADYLEAQLLAFKRSSAGPSNPGSQDRSHPAMELFLRNIADARLGEAAQYYSRLECSPR